MFAPVLSTCTQVSIALYVTDCEDISYEMFVIEILAQLAH
jgi:hypothetical protein